MKKKASKRSYMPLVEALQKYSDKETVRFHMPGHKGRGLGRTSRLLKKNLYKWDVTEIPGLDDLHQPRGAIKEAQQRLSKLCGADESFFW